VPDIWGVLALVDFFRAGVAVLEEAELPPTDLGLVVGVPTLDLGPPDAVVDALDAKGSAVDTTLGFFGADWLRGNLGFVRLGFLTAAFVPNLL